MSEQAIETDDEVVIEEPIEGIIEDSEEEAEAESAVIEDLDDGEVEIFVEGEEEPTSKPVRKSGFQKRLAKLTGRIEEADNKADAERIKRETVEAERDMWRLKATQTEQSGPPNEDDFDDPAEFNAAKAKYDENRIAEIAETRVNAILEEAQGKTTQANQGQEFETKLRGHYAQAEKLKIPDFEEAEDKVSDTIGTPVLNYIITNHEQSAAMIFYLSRNSVKAQELYELSLDPLKNGVRLAQRLTRLEDSLKFRPKHSPAASPETVIETGVSKTDQVYLRGARFE
ncbi:MAG: hypothetical protein GY942_20925 [Aestuariibacter sp.]|nr:hypothetical protein [Aestuariibacter sp.]